MKRPAYCPSPWKAQGINIRQVLFGTGTGHTAISISKNQGKVRPEKPYQVVVSSQGKKRWGGRHATLEEAVAARDRLLA